MGIIDFENHDDLDPDIRLALNVVYRIRKNLTYQERLSIAYQALMYAKEGLDESKGKLSTYLHYTVMKALNQKDTLEECVVRLPKKKKQYYGQEELYEKDLVHDDGEPMTDDSTEYEIGVMHEAMGEVLSDKHAYITTMFLSGRMGLKDIGKVVGMSKQRCHQIAMSSAEKIRRHLGGSID